MSKNRGTSFSQNQKNNVKRQGGGGAGYWGILGIGEGRAGHWGIWGGVNTIFHQTTENPELIGHCHIYTSIYIYGGRSLIPVREVLLPAPPVRGRETSVCRNPDAMETCMSLHNVALIVKYPRPPSSRSCRIQTRALPYQGASTLGR